MEPILPIILQGFNRQSLQNFELIFADDGSSDKSRQIIESFSFRPDISVTFITQQDKGFRKCRILNKAVISSQTEYLIFTDGDCIPHYKFAEDHFINKKQHTVLCGRRVMLDSRLSQKIKQTQNLNLLNLQKIFSSGSSMKYESLYLGKAGSLFNTFHKPPTILGSNFSVHKKDILAVNGFDERYEAPGVGEDNDLQLRLSNNQERFQWLRNRAVQYHLYHKKRPVPKQNLELYYQNKNNNVVSTEYGIKQRNKI